MATPIYPLAEAAKIHLNISNILSENDLTYQNFIQISSLQQTLNTDHTFDLNSPLNLQKKVRLYR